MYTLNLAALSILRRDVLRISLEGLSRSSCSRLQFVNVFCKDAWLAQRRWVARLAQRWSKTRKLAETPPTGSRFGPLLNTRDGHRFHLVHLPAQDILLHCKNGFAAAARPGALRGGISLRNGTRHYSPSSTPRQRRALERKSNRRNVDARTSRLVTSPVQAAMCL